MPKEISLHKNYFDTTIRNVKTGNQTKNRTRTNRLSKGTSMSKEIFLDNFFFDTTIRNTKTGNRTENRTPDHRENFMCK